MNSLFALWLSPGGVSVAELAILIVIVAAVIALVYVALRQFGVAIPEWVKQIFWIIVVAVSVSAAIRLVAGM